MGRTVCGTDAAVEKGWVGMTMKLKVLIVDDEIYICRLVQSLIRWEDLDLTCLALCQSADEALVAIEYQMPHIVITDIRLGEGEEKDGLALVKLLAEKYPDIRCILISGYQRFEYAQMAVKWGVKDYLLKPISREELNSCLESVARDIRSHMLQIEELPPNKSAREYFLLKLAYKNLDFITYGIGEVNEKFAYHFSASCFCLGIIKLDDSHHLCENLESFGGKIKNLFKQVFGELCSDLEMVLEDTKAERFVFLVNYSPAVRERIRSRIVKFREVLSSRLRSYPGIHVTAVVGQEAASVAGLVSSYGLCMEWEAGRVVLGTDQVLEADHGLMDEKISLDPDRYHLSHYMDLLDMEGIREACESVIQDAVPQFARSPHKTADWFREFFAFFIRGMGRLHLDFDGREPEEYRYIRELRHFPSVQVLKEQFLSSVEEIVLEYTQNKQKPKSSMIQEIDRYIYEHYDSKISLETIAGAVHLSSAYLGILYKKETNQNLSDAIARVRIEKAKEKLSQTDDSITEIAISVGYRDIKSFRKQFLKNVGVTPSEYREFHR